MKSLYSRWFAPLSCTGLLIASLLLAGCRGQLSPNPPIHPNWNMDSQKRVEAQEENLFFKDRRGMRPLIEGTVARGWLRADSAWYAGKDQAGNYVKALPAVAQKAQRSEVMKRLGYQPGQAIKLDTALIARGQEQYNVFCTPCHGYNGDGKGIVTKYSNGLVPQNLHSEYVRKMAPGQIYEAMAKGVRSMPAFSSQLEVFDRWAIVAYVRALQLTRTKGVAKKGEGK